MKVGTKVKIEDIGPLATCIQAGKHMAKFEIDGEQFWMPVDMVAVVEMEV